ncbi:unnamed protein product, partial [marine sediment metagenome]
KSIDTPIEIIEGWIEEYRREIKMMQEEIKKLKDIREECQRDRYR